MGWSWTVRYCVACGMLGIDVWLRKSPDARYDCVCRAQRCDQVIFRNMAILWIVEKPLTHTGFVYLYGSDHAPRSECDCIAVDSGEKSSADGFLSRSCLTS